MRKVGSWTDIILEGYCIGGTNKNCPKGKKIPKSLKGGYEGVKPISRKLVPEYYCLVKDCPYFGYSNGVKRLYLHCNKFYDKKKSVGTK